MDPTASGSNDLLMPVDVLGYHASINVLNLIKVFMSILLEAMPFIVLGAIIAGLLEELVPQKLITRLLPRNRFLAIAVGALLGLIFPMCECGIIPVMRRLLRKGLPVSCCVAYLLAGPIINVVVMLSTYMAFEGKEGTPVPAGMAPQMGGLWMMGMRMGLGYLVAIGTSLIVDWQYRKHGNKLLTPLAAPSGLAMAEDDAQERRRPVGGVFPRRLPEALHLPAGDRRTPNTVCRMSAVRARRSASTRSFPARRSSTPSGVKIVATRGVSGSTSRTRRIP